MGKYIINGGNRLSGIIDIGGSKNAALPVLCASVINGGRSVIRNCPDISDVRDMCALLRRIGCDVKAKGHTIVVDSSSADAKCLCADEVGKIRSSVTLLGAMAGRFGNFSISKPGGCSIGKRPVDIHIDVLKKLGAEVEEKDGSVDITSRKLTGAVINLPFASVGATENAMMAAVFAEGTTAIVNAAKEPEVVCLQNYLKSIGVKIYGAENGTIIIEGCKKFRDAEFDIICDRIESGTFLCSCASCGGEVLLKNAPWKDMIFVLKVLSSMGVRIHPCSEGIYCSAKGRLKALKLLQTGVYPSFPTDMQPQMTALLAKSKGKGAVIETVFEKRMEYTKELEKMGAQLSASDRVCIFSGVKYLKGAILYAKDLRAGAALINAALSAEGRSEVYGTEFVERGYENIEKKLKSAGADICLEN